MVRDLALRIRRRETPFYDRLYRFAKWLRSIEIPLIKPIHRPLYAINRSVNTIWDNLTRVFYYQPLFKSRCSAVGKGLYLFKGMPLVMGHVELNLGKNVKMFGATTISGSKHFDRPRLVIGDDAYLGYNVSIAVGDELKIGKHVYVADRVVMAADDGHPVNPEKRRLGLPAEPESIRPITIEDDVWIGTGAIILKGVTIGRCSIVAAGSVVTKSIPPFSIAAGNPARVIKAIDSRI